ncbi:MAG TPA: hypothetical protein VD772_12780, partial [Anseongella sp.]|nr:hypothetical protein [Anseongella sp.]
MKRLLLLAAAVFAGGQLMAQETDTVHARKDTVRNTTLEISGEGVRITFGEKQKKKEKEKDVFDFGIFNGLDLGFNAFMQNGDLNLPPGSENFKQHIGNSTNVQ